MNTIGNILRLTTFGESHAMATGGVLDGFPAGVKMDMAFLEAAMARRSPAQKGIGSGRQEADRVEILCGVYEREPGGDSISLGTPLAFIIRNTDAHSEDYAELKHAFRPSHADDTYFHKYGIRDERGGGRASARETAVRVAAGAFAEMFLQQATAQAACGPVRIQAEIDRMGGEKITSEEQMHALIENCRQEKDSLGGIIRCTVRNMPRNLGEPVYDKLTARLAQAMMSIPASRGFEIGQGFAAAAQKGSTHNDRWNTDGTTVENLSGGVRGGISTGEDLVFRIAFKPIASIARAQNLLTEDGRLQPYTLKGRHDVCCVPRAVPVVRAMTALVLADFMLLNRCAKL